MGPETITLVYGLGSAVAWGAGDFSGGFAAKKGGVFMVMLPSQVVCGICYALTALAWNQPFPPFDELALGCLAGMGGGFGMAALLRGLSTGRMGIVAPISGVVGAAVPIVVALFVMGFPGVSKTAGFGLAFVAVWRISSPGTRLGASKEEIWMAVLAGLGFGLFFVIIGFISRHAIFWPLAVSKIPPVALSIFMVMKRGTFDTGVIKAGWPFMVAAGALDALGTIFYSAAAAAGRMDVAAVLGSLYPAFTVLLAWMVLKEHLTGRQWSGVLAALAALALISS